MAFYGFHNKKIHYDSYRSVVPEDTVFIHGNLASGRWWQPTLEKLREIEPELHRPGLAFAYDWLGCGQSSAPVSEFDLEMESLGRDLVELVKVWGLDEVNLVAHSTGGLIALEAMRLAPELFSKAVLLDPVSPKGIQFGPEMLEAFTKMSQDTEFCAEILASTIYQVDRQDPFVQQLCEDAYGVSPLIWHGIPHVLARTDLTKYLKQIKQAVLVLHGEYDTLLPKEESRQLAHALGNGNFEELKGQGHCCNIENPMKFAKRMWDFLY